MIPAATVFRSTQGQLINLLDWVYHNGPQKWADDITYDADWTIDIPFILGKNITVNATKTLTATALMPVYLIGDTVTINGTVTATGKGCSGTGAAREVDGYRCVFPTSAPLFYVYSEEKSPTLNYSLCGSGSAGGGNSGGGAFKTGACGYGASCDLTDAELKQLLLSPLYNLLRIGLGGGGGGKTGGATGGAGGGQILVIAKTIVVGSDGSLLANGVGEQNGGGGGFVGLFGQSISVDGAATITANGGDGSAYDGGNGITVQIEV
jgi:hypothetical protein